MLLSRWKLKAKISLKMIRHLCINRQAYYFSFYYTAIIYYCYALFLLAYCYQSYIPVYYRNNFFHLFSLFSCRVFVIQFPSVVKRSNSNEFVLAIKYWRDSGTVVTGIWSRVTFPKMQTGYDMKLYFNDNAKWKCNKRTFNETKLFRFRNLLKGSCRLPIVIVIRIVYCRCKEPTSVDFCDRQLNMSKQCGRLKYVHKKNMWF